MQENFSGNTNVENELKNADLLMASGRWAEAESALRGACLSDADLTLRLAQLQWRKECAEYASGLDLDALGENGIYSELVTNFDKFVADWVINEYKG